MSPKRRGRGEGTYERRGGGVYRLRVFIGVDPLTGRPRQASKTVRVRNDTEARRELRRFVTEAEAGRVAKVGRQATVGSLLEAWLKNLERAGRSRSTVDTYRVIARAHLIPAFGHLPLGKVDGFVLDQYYDAKLAQGRAPRTVRLHHSVLSSAFTQALKWGWVDRNPAAQATPPGKPNEDKMIPEVDEVRKLIVAAEGDYELSTAVMLAAITGARRGELCGLQWPDVDWEGQTLRIARARVPTEGGDHTTPTKTKMARTVAVGPLGVAVLERYRALTDARAAELGVERVVDGWLLSHDCGRSPLNARGLGEAISGLGKQAGVPVTTHAFRRFAATQMVGAGVDVRTAAGRLGHTPDMLLRVYAGFMPSRDRVAAEGLEALVLVSGDERDG